MLTSFSVLSVEAKLRFHHFIQFISFLMDTRCQANQFIAMVVFVLALDDGKQKTVYTFQTHSAIVCMPFANDWIRA